MNVCSLATVSLSAGKYWEKIFLKMYYWASIYGNFCPLCDYRDCVSNHMTVSKSCHTLLNFLLFSPWAEWEKNQSKSLFHVNSMDGGSSIACFFFLRIGCRQCSAYNFPLGSVYLWRVECFLQGHPILEFPIYGQS